MSQLGSIFEPDSGVGPRGRDLRVEVTVPGSACGDPHGFAVPVALDVPALGGYARRVVRPEDGDAVHLHLPHDFPEGGTLRLRGQGEAIDGGRAGDLLLTVHVEGPRPAPPPSSGAVATWPSGQVMATSPPAPTTLVLVVAVVFAAGLAVIVLL